MKNRVRWDNLTRPEIKELADKGAIVLIPLGSTEQHGPHLPVGTDALLATLACEKTAQELCAMGKPAVVTPVFSITNSIHHMSFPGTLTLDAETYMEALTEVCECIAEHGFTKIAMINGHGGNRLPTQTVIMNIVEELGFKVYMMEYYLGSEKIISDTLETQNRIVHACEAETSMMLAYYPELVDPIYKETKGGNITKNTTLGDGPYTFRRFEESTECGALGNSYAATPEKGKIIMEAMGKNLAKVISGLWE